jgi:hypothetical protein
MRRFAARVARGDGLLLAVAAAGLAWGLPIVRSNPLPGLVPVGASTLLLLLSGLAVLRERHLPAAVSGWRAPAVMGLLVLYVAAMETLGYSLATGSFVVAAMIAIGVRDARTVALVLAVLLGLALGVFQALLGVRLPPGTLL